MDGNMDVKSTYFIAGAGTQGSASSYGAIVIPNLVFRPRLAASTAASGSVAPGLDVKPKSAQTPWDYVHDESNVVFPQNHTRNNRATTPPPPSTRTSKPKHPSTLFRCTSDSTTQLPSPSLSTSTISPSSSSVPLDWESRHAIPAISTPTESLTRYQQSTPEFSPCRPILQPRGPLAKKRTVSFSNRTEIIPQSTRPTWKLKSPPPDKKKSLKRKVSACSLDDGYEASIETQLRETLRKRPKCYSGARRESKRTTTCKSRTTREKFIKQRIRQVRMSKREKAAIDDGMHFLNEIAGNEDALRSVWEKTGVNLRVLLTTVGGLAKLVKSETRV